ncbi:MAG: hypothetical protein KBD23_03085 [Gammaproteobacteria bacterium]|nr:hypothetical protein [Gammaproteobacteria bacterium]MBP9729110.1 hypothetical protein [Gammaproteobacteria bacterium]
MIARLYYAGQHAWRYRKALANYAQNSVLQAKTVLDVDLDLLKQQGIQGLILDFDGVLAAHAAPRPLAMMEDWLRKALSVFKPHQLFILSNQPTKARQAYFQTYFPGISFVCPQRKKPFIDGIQVVLDTLGVAPQQVLLMDDRLLTGILAALIAGIQGCYVTAPWIDWKKRPFLEAWYYLLRRVERWLLTRAV